MGAEPSEEPLADCSFPFSALFPPGIPTLLQLSSHTCSKVLVGCTQPCTAEWAVGVGQEEFPLLIPARGFLSFGGTVPTTCGCPGTVRLITCQGVTSAGPSVVNLL